MRQGPFTRARRVRRRAISQVRPARCHGLITAPLLILGAQEADTTHGPLVSVLLSAKVHGGDEVEPRALGVLVERAHVGVLGVVLLRALEAGGDEDHRKRGEEHLGVRIDELALVFVPLAPIEEETVDINALLWAASHLVFLRFLYLIRRGDVIKGPVLLDVLATHLLAVRREEALRVEEAGKPEAVGPVVLHPAEELLVTPEDIHPPQSDVRHD
mmetsp:Transcript_2703/g.7733  ORF Transcript_2703/g.7733 Transcript_2703/m.7733 type:complete len:215 (+) Transcript_2703:228-872(+)